MSVHQACCSNIKILAELESQLQFMSHETYVRQQINNRGIKVSSIGAHCRHVIEFYHSFVCGLSARYIDYDARRRDPKLEQSRDSCINQLQEIFALLDQLTGEDDKTIKLSAQVSTDQPPLITKTSLSRELIFLQTHSTHHLAIISMLLTSYGKQHPENFGIATSTRIFREKQNAD